MSNYFDIFMFVALPYMAVIILLIVSIQRYRTQPFTYSSLSTQLLENKRHFWAMVPFHYGIIAVFVGHLLAFLMPQAILSWNSAPLRLYLLEVTGLAFGVLTFVGLIAIIARRFTNSKLRVVTTPIDIILYVLLLIQVVTGIALAVIHPWGSTWFAVSLTPYLRSLFTFGPDISYIVGMPMLVKMHIINSFLIVGLFPFTRLVHVLVIPFPYLWRKPQVVRWYSDKSDST